MLSEGYEQSNASLGQVKSDASKAPEPDTLSALDEMRPNPNSCNVEGLSGAPEEIIEADAIHLHVADSPDSVASDSKCPVCLDSVCNAYHLPFNHDYCRDCLKQYFASKIMYAETEIRCFAPLKNNSQFVVNSNVTPQCNQIIPDDVILTILRDEDRLSHKYERFSFFNAHPDGRECPKCDHRQVGSASQPSMVCESCGEAYCFLHGLAHGANETCAEYEAKNAHETELNTKELRSSSKPCPKCGVHIAKIGGCNHMKCPQCKTAFCWICGRAIEDDVFPAHFQWWNPRGCSNMQMDEAIAPSRAALLCGRITAFLQAFFLGIPTAITTAMTFCVCGPCCVNWTLSGDELRSSVVRVAQQHLTIWGGIWLFVVVMLPTYVVVGSIVVVVFLLQAILWLLFQGLKRSFLWLQSVWKSKFLARNDSGNGNSSESKATVNSGIDKEDTIEISHSKRFSVRLNQGAIDNAAPVTQSLTFHDLLRNYARQDMTDASKTTYLPAIDPLDGTADANAGVSINEIRALLDSLLDCIEAGTNVYSTSNTGTDQERISNDDVNMDVNMNSEV